MPLSGSPQFRRPDIKIWRRDGRPGTAGCVVRRSADQQLYLLSNAHVMGWTGEAAQPGDPIFIDDGANGERQIAVLEDWAPRENAQGSQPFDAAIARLLNQNDPAIERIGVPKVCNPLLREDMQVHMTGARSGGPNHSTVDKLTFPLTIRLHRHDGADIPFRFSPLILCEDTFSDHGDSGSAVYDVNGALIGLVSGACPEGTVFCRANLIFDRFGLTPAA